MEAVFENSLPPSNETIVGLNSEFKETYESLIRRKDRYLTNLVKTNENQIFALKLLDGKWGNFCYCPGLFMAVSVSTQLWHPSGRGIQIHLYPGNLSADCWNAFYLFFNYEHKRNSLKKSSSAFARSVVKRAASCKDYVEAYSYLANVQKSREELFKEVL